MRRYGPKPRTRRDREIAALVLKTVTDDAPVTQEGFDARVAELVCGVARRLPSIYPPICSHPMGRWQLIELCFSQDGGPGVWQCVLLADLAVARGTSTLGPNEAWGQALEDAAKVDALARGAGR